MDDFGGDEALEDLLLKDFIVVTPKILYAQYEFEIFSNSRAGYFVYVYTPKRKRNEENKREEKELYAEFKLPNLKPI